MHNLCPIAVISRLSFSVVPQMYFFSFTLMICLFPGLVLLFSWPGNSIGLIPITASSMVVLQGSWRVVGTSTVYLMLLGEALSVCLSL